MKMNRILVVIVIVLIAVNCALLSFLWFNIYPAKKRPMQGPAFEYLSKELQLTPAQKTQYEKMRDAHAHFADSLNTQNRMMRDSFFEHIKDPLVKGDAINMLEKKISDNTAKLDTSTFYHFRKFRAILTTAQQQKFDEVIQDVLHSMGGGRPPQGGPPPNGGGREGMQPGPSPNGPHGRNRQHPGPPQGWPPRDGRRGPPPNGGPPPDGPPPNGGPPPLGGPPQS